MQDMDVGWLETVGVQMAEDAWDHCPPGDRREPYAAFMHGHGAGLLSGFRSGLDVMASLLSDPEMDAVPRSMLAAKARDLIGQIEDRYVTKVPA